MRRTSILVPVLILAAAAGGARAERASLPLADYRSESWFLPQSPGVTGGPAAGLFNPAAPALGSHGSFDFWADDREGRGGWDNFGLAFGSNVNFAVMTSTWGVGGSAPRTYDYQLGLAGGDRGVSAGLGYRWARGERPGAGREQALVLGLVSRPERRVSVGLAGALSLESRAAQYVLDVGLRPLGRDWLTLFADWTFHDDQSFFRDGSWGAGLELRPVRGLHLGGRARERADEGAVDWSLVLGVTLQRVGFTGMPLFDRDGTSLRTTYLLRTNPPFSGLADDRPLRKRDRSLALDLQNKVLTYQKARWFDERHVAWLDLLRLLAAVEDDPDYGEVSLNLADFRGRPSLMWELRRKLDDLRAAGKEVRVHVARPDALVMLVAAGADRVTMDPQGMLALPGFSLSRSYLKGTLEKLGIGFQEWRYFEFKSAAETLSRTSMSDADRLQRQRVVDVIEETVHGGVAAGRGLTLAAVRRASDEQTLLMAEEARAAGLVDAVGRWEEPGDEDAARRRRRAGGPPRSLGRETTDDQWGRLRRIPVVFAVGPCAMDEGIEGRATAAYLRGLVRDPRVPAVVLRVDSPGGDPLPSDLVAAAVRALRDAGKPVIVSQGDVAASGGYWLSMDGDEILTTPLTLTGSIGVIGGWVWDDGLAARLGVTSDAVARGAHADLFTVVRMPFLGALPRRAMTDAELARTRELVLAHYDAFVAGVARGRGLSEETVRVLAEGRVWMGGDAVANGLCDGFGTLEEAIALARSRAGVPDWEEIDVVEYPPRKLFALPRFLPRLPSVLPFGAAAEAWLARAAGVAPTAGPSPEPPPVLPGLGPLDTAFVRAVAEHAGQPLLMVAPDELPPAWRRVD